MSQGCSEKRDCTITSFKLCLEEVGNRSSNDGAKILWEEEIVVALWDQTLTNGEEIAENRKVEVNEVEKENKMIECFPLKKGRSEGSRERRMDIELYKDWKQEWKMLSVKE